MAQKSGSVSEKTNRANMTKGNCRMREHSSSKKVARKAFDSAAAAASWLKLGIAPVPLAPRSKRPKGENGKANDWPNLRVTDETVRHFFVNGDNIGGLWGEPSNWVIDIDLDIEEAQILAQHFLPETYMYGRASAVSSHYLYRCLNAQT